MNKIVVR